MVATCRPKGPQRLAAIACVAIGLLPNLAAAQSIGHSGSTLSSVRVDESVPLPELIGQLNDWGRSPYALEPEQLTDLSRHPEPLVRLSVSRLLSVHPDMEEPGTLIRLAEDPNDAVALAALLALARSYDPAATGALEARLGEARGTRRELAAVALLVRGSLGASEPFEPVPADLLERSRPWVASEQGRRWLTAIDRFERLEQTQQRWGELQRTLLRRQTDDGEIGRCLRLARANPGLLQHPGPDGVPLTPLAWPDTANVRRIGERPADLLITARHDEMSDDLFERDDQVRELERFLEHLNTFCQADRHTQLPPIELIGIDTIRGPFPGRDVRGFAGVGLGVINNPLAYRDGAGEFLIGDDVELTLIPDFRVAVLDGAEELDQGTDDALPDVVDGWGLELRAGAVLSTAFFKNRSRPSGAARFVWDDPLTPGRDHRYRARRTSAQVELSPGAGDVSRDITHFVAPHLDSAVAVDWLRVTGSDPSAWQDQRFTATLGYTEYLFDDPAYTPRDRRWLQASAEGYTLFGRPSTPLRAGIQGLGAARSSEGVDEVVASIGALGPLMRWHGREMRIDIWVGVAGGGVFNTPDEFSDTGGFIDVAGGFTADFRTELGLLDFLFNVELARQPTLMGRNGYAGRRESARAGVGLLITSAMSEPLALNLLAERDTPSGSSDVIGWGGLELIVPVGIIELDQVIRYEMRYLALIDEARFSNRSQEVFEALLTAGSRF